MDLSNTIGLFNGPRIEMEEDWKVCRALEGGTRAMREAGITFTPRTAREKAEPDLYRERLDSSVLLPAFVEATSRIAGRPFEKPPTFSGREQLDPFLDRMIDDADRTGRSLSVFGSMIYNDAVRRGAGYFLVDNVPRPEGMTLSEAEAIDARPYLCRIEPDNIIGFQSEVRFGREVCTELRVREWKYRPRADGIGDELVQRVRRYTGETVELWEATYGKSSIAGTTEASRGYSDLRGYKLIEGPTPTGFPNGEIPLVVVYTKQLGFMHARPPLIGLAQLNVKHWNQQSILDSAVRYCMHPILFGRGLASDDAQTPPKVGEGARFMTTSDTADMRFVEIAGTSLTIARAEIEKTEYRMKSSAVEPLQKGSATATGEVRAETSEMSEAQQWVEAMEWALFRAFEIAAQWIGADLPDDFNVALYRASSMIQAMSGARTVALKADADQGYITLETYLKERARSGDFADDFDPQAEAEAVTMEKERSQQAQMEAMLRQVQAEGQPQPGQPPQEGQQEDEPQDREEDQQQVPA